MVHDVLRSLVIRLPAMFRCAEPQMGLLPASGPEVLFVGEAALKPPPMLYH